MEASPLILVLNAGSSSIKFACYPLGDGAESDQPLVHGAVRGLGEQPTLEVIAPNGTVRQPLGSASATDPFACGIARVLTAVGEQVQKENARDGLRVIHAVGHRVVHGGEAFPGPAVVTAAVREELENLIPLAPLHMPHNLRAIDMAATRLPGAVQVACFDTAFHRSCPPLHRRFAIPRRFHDAGLKRYGFHGLSYEFVTDRLKAGCGTLPRRVVLAHLGAGGSLCGLLDGQSVTTTMGYTPLDGLVMATRCGAIDPGAVLALCERFGLTVAEVQRLLSEQSGLLGVSGISGDMQTLLASTDPRAEEAVELFCQSVLREVGAVAAVLGGIDALCFTGGIGSNAPAIRRRVCAALGWLGIRLDEAANESCGPCGRIDAEGPTAVWVIETDEQAVIARQVRQVVGG